MRRLKCWRIIIVVIILVIKYGEERGSLGGDREEEGR